ncbi:MAG: 3-oxoacyl-ACP reductase FabG [Bacteroidetes bacterium]|nr:MAG: 3-oxoacyl-ACP reductase FabG [Bacteroidota bacterium]
MQRLADKVAIITGAARGIGKSAAVLFAAEGAKVVIWDVAQEAGEATAAEITAAGGSCTYMQVNTSDLAAVEAAAAKVHADFDKIDILINNAGITRDAAMKKMSTEQWDQVIAVNLTGVFYCAKAVSAYMVEAGYGRIVNTSSVVGLTGNFGQINYTATKAGVIGMTKTLARELGRKGITANAVAPGFIATEMVETIPEKVIDMVKSRTPLGRLGTPEDIANAYLFLASDDAAYVSGTVLSVDGAIAW